MHVRHTATALECGKHSSENGAWAGLRLDQIVQRCGMHVGLSGKLKLSRAVGVDGGGFASADRLSRQKQLGIVLLKSCDGTAIMRILHYAKMLDSPSRPQQQYARGMGSWAELRESNTSLLQ
jgi:hypothetical protein